MTANCSGAGWFFTRWQKRNGQAGVLELVEGEVASRKERQGRKEKMSWRIFIHPAASYLVDVETPFPFAALALFA